MPKISPTLVHSMFSTSLHLGRELTRSWSPSWLLPVLWSLCLPYCSWCLFLGCLLHTATLLSFFSNPVPLPLPFCYIIVFLSHFLISAIVPFDLPLPLPHRTSRPSCTTSSRFMRFLSSSACRLPSRYVRVRSVPSPLSLYGW